MEDSRGFPGGSIMESNETWDKVKQPHYGEGKFDLKLGVLGSDLVVLCNYKRTHSVIRVMNNGVEASWEKMFTISSADVPVPYDYDNYQHLRMPFTPQNRE
ncbi:hypothetical protein CQW23_28825 [Capsicum baccatum]|uniref:Uncharacterized protein n=1 Tax=Capsicum baccatum TaxID=33114 RepID=A0A2G2VHR7_CAPBA|nr:hypothetical protein CQW23_28825 [Capsicum baccatum]